MNKSILTLTLSVFTIGIMAQKVESTAYGLMLKGLLSHSVQSISVKDASELNSITFLDARELNEFNVSHLKNAKHIGFEQPNLSILDSLNHEDTVIIYCSVGYRSEKMAEKIKRKGFKNVYNLYGGIFEWKNQGFSVFQGQNQTDKVHAYNRVWGIWLSKGEKVYD